MHNDGVSWSWQHLQSRGGDHSPAQPALCGQWEVQQVQPAVLPGCWGSPGQVSRRLVAPFSGHRVYVFTGNTFPYHSLFFSNIGHSHSFKYNRLTDSQRYFYFLLLLFCETSGAKEWLLSL